jgi:diacylglycerol O-acyltransferase
MGERLSALDTMFLDLEQVDDGATMHFGAVMLFDPLPEGGTPTIERVRDHLQRRLPLLPRYREQLSGPRAGPLKWTSWEPAPRFEIAAHVRHATLPAPGGDGELSEWFADFLSHRVDRGRPLWETVLLDGLAGGHWALVTKTHHCLVDGMGAVDVSRVLLDDRPDPPRRRPPGGWTIAGSDHQALPPLYPEALGHAARAGAGAVRHPRDTLARAAAIADLLVHEELISAPETSLNGALAASRDYRAVRVQLAQIKALQRALGGTVNDVVLAISAGALRRLLLARGETPPPRGLRAQIPVNIRTSGDEHALGNVLTSLFVELPVAEPDPLARHHAIVERARGLKGGSQARGGKALIDLAALAPPVVGELMGRALFGGQRAFNLTITNVRGSRTPLYMFGAPMREVLPYVPLFAGHRVGIAVVSYAGGLVFGLGADRVSTPDLDVLAAGVQSSLDELRRAARRSLERERREATTA